MIIPVILILIHLAKAIGGASNWPQSESGGNALICDTSECNIMSEFIRNNMNSSEPTCDNFYGYTCKQNDLVRFGDKVQRILEAEITNLILGKSTLDKDTERIRKFYTSCMERDSNELDKLISDLKTQGRNMDLLGYSWPDMLVSLAREGFGDGQLFQVGRPNLRHSKLEVSCSQ